jgi:hypothetical protein
LTFGLVFLDADLDGRLDMALANGHIEPDIAAMQKGIAHAQPPQIFANAGGVFREARQALDAAAAAPRVGRGLAAGDLDGDGDPDLILTQNGERASLLRCDREGDAVKHSFLKVVLEGRPGNPRAIGAVVRATIAGRTEERWVRTGSSYLSQGETSLTFGLGGAHRVEKLEVRWPWGGLTTLADVPASAVPLRVRP